MSFFFGSDLWDEMERMQQQLQDLTGEVDSKRTRKGGKRCRELCPCSSKQGALTTPAAFNPFTDLAETPDSYVVSMDLPGVKKEELNVSVHNGVLTVSGTRRHKFVSDDKDEKKEEEKPAEAAAAAADDKKDEKKEEKPKHKVLRMESYYGSFERSVSVPPTTKPEDVHAKFEDGVLTVTIAKPHKDEPKKIEVQ